MVWWWSTRSPPPSFCSAIACGPWQHDRLLPGCFSLDRWRHPTNLRGQVAPDVGCDNWTFYLNCHERSIQPAQ